MTTIFYCLQSSQSCSDDTESESSSDNQIYPEKNSDQQHYTETSDISQVAVGSDTESGSNEGTLPNNLREEMKLLLQLESTPVLIKHIGAATVPEQMMTTTAREYIPRLVNMF